MYASRQPIWGMSFGSMPQDIAITCARCNSRANFSAPFIYLSKADAATFPKQHPNACRIPWGSGVLEERFPREFSWKDQDNPFTNGRRVAGVTQCDNCCRRSKHILNWPADAYFKVNTKAGELWAWNRFFLTAARNYIQSEKRDLLAHSLIAEETTNSSKTSRTGVSRSEIFGFLRELPKEFLRVSNRADVVRRMDRVLTEFT